MAAKKTASKQKAPNFEALVGNIEEQLQKLEAGELSLEDSLGAYEAGVRALKQCHGILKQAEGKIELLMKGEGEAALAEYDVESGQAKAASKPAPAAEPEPEDEDEDEDDDDLGPGSLPF